MKFESGTIVRDKFTWDVGMIFDETENLNPWDLSRFVKVLWKNGRISECRTMSLEIVQV